MVEPRPPHTDAPGDPLGVMLSSDPATDAHAADAPRLGRFVPIERVGAGAMGVVFSAYDPTLDRRVALKVLRGEANRGAQRGRVRQEALALARVQHPNVVPIYDVGEADGRLFIAMEFIDGRTLGAWLADERPGWPAVVDVFRAIGRGLAAAHARDVVHRDFKPDNVLVDGDGHPRIIDFGLARAADDAIFAAARADGAAPGELPPALLEASRDGRLVGTPAYMAPELLEGARPDPASDQFALCVALYEAVWGRPPFPRDSLPAMHGAMVRGVIEAPPPGGWPPVLLAIIRRGLEPDPAARWPSIEALIGALDGIDVERAERLTGGRGRVQAMLFGLAVIGGASVLIVARRPPESATELAEVVSVGGGIGLLALELARRRFSGGALSAALMRLLLLFALAKQAALVLGAVLGATVAQVLAVDAVFFALFVSVASKQHALDVGLLRWLPWVGVAAMLVAREHIQVLHNVVAGAAISAMLLAEVRMRRAAAAQAAEVSGGAETG